MKKMAVTLNVETMSTKLQISIEQGKRTIKTFEAFRYHWCNTKLRRSTRQTKKSSIIKTNIKVASFILFAI